MEMPSKRCAMLRRSPYKNLERAKGIEPSYAAWEAAVLPLNYARMVDEISQELGWRPSGILGDYCLFISIPDPVSGHSIFSNIF